jgi:hypothetical protein
MLDGDTMVWCTPSAAVFRKSAIANICILGDGNDRFMCNVDGKDMHVLARSPEHFSEVCNVIVRLLAASVVHSVVLTWINAPTWRI